MRLPTGYRIWFTASMILWTWPAAAQLEQSNPTQYAAIGAGTAVLNSSVNSQTKGMQKTAALQGTIGAEFAVMKKWENKYSSYLKTAKGYAEALKAGCTLYAEGVVTLRNLYEIKKAVSYNPTGVGATLAMNSLYLEAAVELVETYRLLKISVAKGGKNNMMTGEERTETVWMLADELERLNKKLHKLALSIAYYNMTDVWHQLTAGMVVRTHGEIAGEALDRWGRVKDYVHKN